MNCAGMHNRFFTKRAENMYLRTADIFIFLVIISSTVPKTCAWAHEISIWDTGRRKQKLEPVSITSRRGARAAYHDEYPWDFGPQTAYTVSLASDTSRPPIWQGGRLMSAPRPYETYPFHQPALFTPYTVINISLFTKLFQLFLPCSICNVS